MYKSLVKKGSNKFGKIYLGRVVVSELPHLFPMDTGMDFFLQQVRSKEEASKLTAGFELRNFSLHAEEY